MQAAPQMLWKFQNQLVDLISLLQARQQHHGILHHAGWATPEHAVLCIIYQEDHKRIKDIVFLTLH